MEQTFIYLIRHGESAGNLEGRFRGQKDYPLNELGHQQALNVAQELAEQDFSALYSSPLLRATQTMNPLAEQKNLPLLIEQDLINISLGRWEGRPKTNVAQQEPALWNLWLTEPEALSEDGMESLDSVGRRSLAALDRMVERHKGKTIALCSHRTVLKPLLAFCLGLNRPWFWKLHMDTGSISILTHNELQGYSLIQLNHIAHLHNFNREWN